jgi:hypothetical protein
MAIASKRFKIREIKDKWGKTGFFTVNGGSIGGGRYARATRVAGKANAQAIADARNRLVVKNVRVTRKVRAAKKGKV